MASLSTQCTISLRLFTVIACTLPSCHQCQPYAFQWSLLHCRMNFIYYIHKIRSKIKIFSVTRLQYFCSCKGRQGDIKKDMKGFNGIVTVFKTSRVNRTFILVAFLMSTRVTEECGWITVYVTFFLTLQEFTKYLLHKATHNQKKWDVITLTSLSYQKPRTDKMSCRLLFGHTLQLI